MVFKNITILGSGIMGHGIAQVVATAGYDVVLRDIKQEFLDNAMKKIRWSLDKMVEKDKIDVESADKIYGRITPQTDLKKAVGKCDLVIEAVPEIMDLKKKVYAELDSAASKDAVFASNTSTLPITEIAKTMVKPERFIGIHFFNPPQLMKLVEIIPGIETDSIVTDDIVKFVKSLSKESVTCRKDVPGFIVNRLFIPMAHEACHEMDRTRASMEEIDSAFKFSMGFPMGIFELSDFTGMDVMHKATFEMHLRDAKVVNPHRKIEELFKAGKLGKKSREGFYSYSKDNYERVKITIELAKKYDPLPLLANMLNNAAWLITNKVSDTAEIEKAANLGLGLKKPIFETAKEFGMDKIISHLEKFEIKYGSFYKPDPMLYTMSA
ncbi:MAG: 3-hydroxyacyl-CoA dehydrogenase [Cenarchaeum symbiont of Oopsacas minuta]|nr:3-hydroxyacyl-CoA dehydrogenase [Cenarchaeum symbiont of Oopsacas minuta]